METDKLRLYIAETLRNAELAVKLNDMMVYIMNSVVVELNDTKYKNTQPSLLSEDMIKAIVNEQGFNYIVDVMDTITGFEFDRMLSFIDLINQLKGTRKGLELVLRLMGFDSIIKEWWQDAQFDQDPWTYEIIVIVNSSIVPDIYNTLSKIKTFSQNYVIAKVTNIELRFSSDNFAYIAPLMGGFATTVSRGRILERANP